ncbi:PEP-CTERM sorting domain-containing protein [Crateriforma conspicua]|uniref:PEP-CTERM sorting domain-containing protein n=1 Tax=Crateriforma conspicua TaxID=2527996 RepID=UPI0013FCF6E7|nr:PEP-CTERM sorting domain-containing protein [Crateriforma conspicua]
MTLTLNVTAAVNNTNTAVLNLGTSNGLGVDITNVNGQENANFIDDGRGTESVEFAVASSTGTDTSVRLTGIGFGNLTSAQDEAMLEIAGVTTSVVQSDLMSGSLSLSQLLNIGDSFEISHAEGNGFSILSLTFEAAGVTPVPEPTTLVLIGLAGGGAAALRRRKRQHAC